MPNTFWLKDLHLRALRFQFTLPPTTLGLCQYIFRCLQDSATKVAFESYDSLLWPILFRQSSGNFSPRISHDSKNWNPWFRLWPPMFLEVIFRFITSLLLCSPDLIHFVWLGDTNHQCKSIFNETLIDLAFVAYRHFQQMKIDAEFQMHQQFRAVTCPGRFCVYVSIFIWGYMLWLVLAFI